MNAFAIYNNELWNEYRSLGRNLSGLESDMIKGASVSNAKQTFSFLNFSVKEVSNFRYVLFTDANGALFIKGISNYMKEYFLYENVQALYSGYESIKGLLENGEFDMTKIDVALETLKDADSLKETETKETETNIQKETVVADNPMEEVKKLQKKGILKLVLKDTDIVSDKKTDIRQSVSNRSLEKGTLEIETNPDWMDTMLFQQYLFQYFSSYINQKEDGILDYELEYLIGKKDNDTANLKETVNKILLTRQAANMLYLLNDTEKLATAHTAALSFLAVGVPPAMLEVVKMGIVAAWAYAESILDVRALLAGKKIPFIKSNTLWTLDVDKIASISEGFLMAKESESGISYEQYLRMLLFFEEEKNLAFYAMDVMESNIRKNDSAFYLDEIATGVALEIKYEYNYLFLSFQFLPVGLNGKPIITKTTQFFYALE